MPVAGRARPHRPNPSRCLGFVDRSRGPSKNPSRSAMSSPQLLRRLRPARSRSRASRTTFDWVRPSSMERLWSHSAKGSGNLTESVFIPKGNDSPVRIEELLQFPVAALRGVVLELVRRAEQRPLQLGGRDVDSATVGVGFIGIQPVRPRADDTAVHDEPLQLEIRRGVRPWQSILEMLQDVEFPTAKRRFKAVGEANKEMRLVAGRCAGHDPDRTGWMDERAVCAAHFDKGADLRPVGDVGGLMGQGLSSYGMWTWRKSPGEIPTIEARMRDDPACIRRRSLLDNSMMVIRRPSRFC